LFVHLLDAFIFSLLFQKFIPTYPYFCQECMYHVIVPVNDFTNSFVFSVVHYISFFSIDLTAAHYYSLQVTALNRVVYCHY